VFLKAFASYRGLAQPVFSDAERLRDEVPPMQSLRTGIVW